MSHDNISLLMWLVHTTCSVCVALFQMHQISLAKQDQQPELCKPSAFNCLLVRQGTNSGFLKRVTNQTRLSYNVPAPHTQAKPLELAWAAAWFCLPSPSRKTGSPVPHWLHKHWMSSSWSIVDWPWYPLLTPLIKQCRIQLFECNASRNSLTNSQTHKVTVKLSVSSACRQNTNSNS